MQRDRDVQRKKMLLWDGASHTDEVFAFLNVS